MIILNLDQNENIISSFSSDSLVKCLGVLCMLWVGYAQLGAFLRKTENLRSCPNCKVFLAWKWEVSCSYGLCSVNLGRWRSIRAVRWPHAQYSSYIEIVSDISALSFFSSRGVKYIRERLRAQLPCPLKAFCIERDRLREIPASSLWFMLETRRRTCYKRQTPHALKFPTCRLQRGTYLWDHWRRTPANNPRVQKTPGAWNDPEGCSV